MNQGSPWWLTALLAVASALIAHFSTLWRENAKSDRQWVTDWRQRLREKTEEIVTSAIAHYTTNDARKNTQPSATLITADLKRLGRILHEARFRVDRDFLTAQRELDRFSSAINDDADFTNGKRKLLTRADRTIQEIQACEDHFLTSCDVLIEGKRRRA